MKVIRKYKKGKKVLLVDKDKKVKELIDKRKKEEDLKFKSSDFKMVSKSAVSFSDIVVEAKKMNKKRIKNICVFIAIFIMISLFIFYILVRFRFINIDLKYLDSKINTSFLYNDRPEDILNLLNEYKINSNEEYTEDNISFELSKKDYLNNSLKEILENTKIEYKRKDLDKDKYIEEVNIWGYNKPIYTNKFAVDGDTIIYDSLILKNKIKTNVIEFRKYLKEYYFYDYIIDKINYIDNISLEKNNFIKLFLESEQDKNINPKIKFNEINYERELKAFNKIILNEVLKEDIFNIINISREDEKIKVNINLNNKSLDNVLDKIMSNESLKNDLIDYIYIYINRKPKYIVRPYGKNEIREKINNIKKDEFLENIKKIENINIIYFLNSYSTEEKSENKIQKIEIKILNKDLEFKIINKKSYQRGKEIKLSTKEEKIFKTKDDIRSSEMEILNINELEERYKTKFEEKIKELKKEKLINLEENEAAVIDAKKIRYKNKINHAINNINNILERKVNKALDIKKINVQEDIKKILLKEINENKLDFKIKDISFKVDISEDMETIIYIIFDIEFKDEKFNIKSKINNNNLLDINKYRFIKI